jgi:hypothetical protein
MMKRSQKAAHVTGCPVCHKPAQVRVVRPITTAAGKPSTESTEYLCYTPTCKVVGFEVEVIVS